MITLAPVTLEGHGVRLEPMMAAHVEALGTAATDGKLWELWYTAIPEPVKTAAYVETALEGQRAGHMLPWVVRELGTGAIVLPGVRIGRGAQVGAGAVVTKDVPDYAVVAGNPARVLRMR